MNTQEILEKLVLFFVPFAISIGIHEWAHIAVARFLGDDTGTRMGRFTLNPLAHLDPMWTIALPLFMLFTSGSVFGAGKPAPYNPSQLTREFGGKRIHLRTAEMLVAAAGPASNVLLAALCIPALILVHLVQFDDPRIFGFFMAAGSLNIVLAVFNLIPVDPLDGGKIIRFFLPYRAHQKYDDLMIRGGFMLMIAAFMGARFVLTPAVHVYREVVIFLLQFFS
ncbi:MAG: site-2 protease family protein [Deltaproteobacteria bacterium]|nr:site-2 protease family protein [Deltaproteobacteria bacterium]